MDTKSTMQVATAAVTGARHLRARRNGQDAAGAWLGQRDLARTPDRREDAASGGAERPSVGARAEQLGAIVVCDGCGSGASSEVGARLGAEFVIASLAARLSAGQRPDGGELWASVRDDVTKSLDSLVCSLGGDRERVIHDHFLFTIIAAAVVGDDIGVWAIGDGAYAVTAGGPACAPRVLGPFDDNRPPYLAYDLLGAPPTAHLETAQASNGTIVVATDGIAELGLQTFTADATRYLAHPDALRRHLTLLATSEPRADWEARRIERTPASLQDDGAMAVLRWGTR